MLYLPVGALICSFHFCDYLLKVCVMEFGDLHNKLIISHLWRSSELLWNWWNIPSHIFGPKKFLWLDVLWNIFLNILLDLLIHTWRVYTCLGTCMEVQRQRSRSWLSLFTMWILEGLNSACQVQWLKASLMIEPSLQSEKQFLSSLRRFLQVHSCFIEAVIICDTVSNLEPYTHTPHTQTHIHTHTYTHVLTTHTHAYMYVYYKIKYRQGLEQLARELENMSYPFFFF